MTIRQRPHPGEAESSVPAHPTRSGIPVREGGEGVNQTRQKSSSNSRSFLAGALILWLLQFGDVWSTHAGIARGGHEANPMAFLLLSAGWLLIVKMVITLAIVARGVLALVPERSIKTPALCLLWFAVGAYSLTIVSNLLVTGVL